MHFPAYIGPGAGFTFLGGFLTLALSIVAALASVLLWPWRLVRSLLLRPKGLVRRAIFLGFDGLDPRITERLMSEGKLPNFVKVREAGSYHRLRTTFPPLSPVAWSTFATGVNPGRHNIFDFLNRDLRTYVPQLSSARVTKGSVELLRRSEPFWKTLGRFGVTSTILRVPITFPPEEFNGRLLSAMCTPDLRGSQGTFSRHTSPEGEIEGPDGEMIPFSYREGFLLLQGERVPLVEGVYTHWVTLRFASARGIARFLLTTDPGFSLYCTPVQIDPEHPAMPISHPRWYSIYLAKLLGAFSTLGMAEDTWALNEGAIDQAAFLEQARLIQVEREQMFFSALDHSPRGVVACVFDTTDRVQHMCFDQPDVIEPLYQDMDRILGQTLQYVDPETVLLVLSDHGFCSFRRGVDLNAWLLQKGYLALKPGADGSTEYLADIDWTRTRAYTFGLAGIYLNLRGREAGGIVPPSDSAVLIRELADKLRGLLDGTDTAIANAYPSTEIYNGPYLAAAPDVIIGYAEGYRAAWDAAVGKVSREVFTDNAKHWCADHCVDPELVPGILFSNRPLNALNPGIEDLAPTALHLFGVARPAWMEGKSLL
ncbi:MAG: type phosphodiesterase/nucleotide pyrophosphatase [Bryobacterales bacterium]|nr:type phosphodiesterase/nucleotide pyrophosphatase [Bryobacterales bacterium]